jgi:ubiquinone/menaquinone biosynthesis C-methylase UbiE
MNAKNTESNAQARFSQFAKNYVTSPTHSEGPDLERLFEVAQPQPEWIALDVATGGGHTALRIAPSVARMVAADFSLQMLEAARENITAKNVNNVTYVDSDGEKMPFADNTFDLITCRVAIHHFPDAYQFFRESARVIKPGGRLVVHDHVQPEDKQALKYLEAFERLRDPSHGRAFSELEWKGLMLDTDFEVEHAEILTREADLIPWAERQGRPPEVIERLQVMLAQAPQAVADWISPRNVLSPDAGFNHVYLLISGIRK